MASLQADTTVDSCWNQSELSAFRNIEGETLDQLKEVASKKVAREIIPGKHLIPAAFPQLNATDLLYGIDAILDGWLTSGKHSRKFEKALANYVGAESSLMVNSGSSANLLAFSTLHSMKGGYGPLKKGDEVITLAAAFPTTVNLAIRVLMIIAMW